MSFLYPKLTIFLPSHENVSAYTSMRIRNGSLSSGTGNENIGIVETDAISGSIVPFTLWGMTYANINTTSDPYGKFVKIASDGTVSDSGRFFIRTHNLTGKTLVHKF